MFFFLALLHDQCYYCSNTISLQFPEMSFPSRYHLLTLRFFRRLHLILLFYFPRAKFFKIFHNIMIFQHLLETNNFQILNYMFAFVFSQKKNVCFRLQPPHHIFRCILFFKIDILSFSIFFLSILHIYLRE